MNKLASYVGSHDVPPELVAESRDFRVGPAIV
jgi:hypothetical protein